MNNFSFISVIVPVYNAERTIGVCIESLLRQDYPKDKYEIIVVDNGSKDGTRGIVEMFKVQYFCEPARGSYAARNAGIKQAKGDILAFTDADCVADKDWLKEGAAAFADESTGCVAGAIKAFKPETYVEKYLDGMQMLSQEESSKFFGFLPYAQTANAFYRADVFKEIGLFEGGWISGGDTDLSWRMQLKTKYKIDFADKSIIYHKHRSTANELFRQAMKNGEGNALLYKKYPQHLQKRTLKQAAWIFYRLVRISLGLIFTSLRKVEAMDAAAQKKYLDNLVFLGRELGRIKGAI